MLVAGSSVLVGLALTGAGVMQSFDNVASASPSGLGQELATDTGGNSEYSICSGLSAAATCSFRGEPGSTEVQGAIAVNGNFTGLNFYIGDHLFNTQTFAAAGSVSGTFAVTGSGVYGGTDTADLPPLACSTNPVPCPEPNLVQASTSPPQPDYSSINNTLETESSQLGALPTTAGGTVTWDQSASALFLTGSNSQQNVFDLAGAGTGVLAGTTDLYINVPLGSSTVINVPETTVNCSSVACLQVVYFWDGSQYEAGNVSPSSSVKFLEANTVLNFPNATSVELSAAAPPSTFSPPPPTSTSLTATFSVSFMPTR